MNAKDQKHEKGQAIIYLVLGLVVFLGFVAMAIDGGMALADRRHVQNSADASSLAGGAAAAKYMDDYLDLSCGQDWSCSGSGEVGAMNAAVPKALARAQANGYVNDADSTVTVNPVCYDAGYIDINVEIAAETPSSFLQLVFPKALENVLNADTRIYPGTPVAFGDAIVALNPEICSDPGSQGVTVGGAGTVTVSKGNIFSNGCIRQNSDVVITFEPGTGAYGHDLFKSEAWAEITSTVILPSEYIISLPNCSDSAAHNVSGTEFQNTIKTTSITGLWCVSGDVKINAHQQIHGTDVTIVMQTGQFWINGGADVTLSAPNDASTGFYPAVRYLLFYFPISNHNQLILDGNQTSQIKGLLYAPRSTITMSGTSANMYTESQVIGWDVVVQGTGDLNLVYYGCDGYTNPPKLELAK